MKWILIVAGVGGLLVCGIMMAVGRRNRSAFAADGAAGIPWCWPGSRAVQSRPWSSAQSCRAES
ncbi:hypothetical protein NKG94_17435 [Micromonospora sp. M12]